MCAKVSYTYLHFLVVVVDDYLYVKRKLQEVVNKFLLFLNILILQQRTLIQQLGLKVLSLFQFLVSSLLSEINEKKTSLLP